MKSTFKIFFYLKKTTPRTNGCVPIMGRITIDGKFVQFSTKLEISPALWNQRTQRANIAKGSSAEATDINERLTYITSRMLELYRELQEQDLYVTAEKVKNAFMGHTIREHTLLSLFRQHLDNLEKVLKVNSKSKILKFWTLFINKKEEEDGDDATAPGETAPEKEPAAEPQFEIAECCKPIPGDKVVGYRDPATGNIIVHKANCDELDRLAAQFGKNIVKDEIKWSQHKAMSYLVTIELRGIDRMGILLDLAKVVSGDFSINIREVSIHSHDGIFEGSISLYVKDAEGLHDVMDKLRKIKGIESVKRTLS